MRPWIEYIPDHPTEASIREWNPPLRELPVSQWPEVFRRAIEGQAADEAAQRKGRT